MASNQSGAGKPQRIPWGLGFRVRFRVRGIGFRVQGLGV